MDDLLSQAMDGTGRGEDEVRGALGLLLGYLRDNCKDSTVEKLLIQAPDLGGLMPPKSSGGLFGSLLKGNAALLALAPKLARLGFGKPELQNLVPTLVNWLRAHLDGELWEELKGQLPAALFG